MARPGIATIAAAAFGLHPLATEAVSYVSGRSMSLGTLLACSCLASWIHARCRGSLAWGAASVLLAGLAALCRETAVLSIPLLVLAWELVREGNPPDARQRVLATARALLPFAAIACATLFWMLFWHERYAALLRLSWWIAQVHAGDASLLTVLGYFGKAALLLQAPSIDPDVSAAALPLAARVLACVAIAAALWWAWRRRSAQPQWLFGAAWVLAWLLPLYTLTLRHDAVSERHLYPVLWGVAWAVAITLAPVMRRAAADASAPARWLGRGLPLAAVLLVLSTMTITRNQDYRSEVLMWESALKAAPHKLRVLNNLGVAYMEAGRWAEATAVLTRALELHPGDDLLPWNLAAAKRRDLRVLTEPVLMEWPALAGAAVAEGR